MKSDDYDVLKGMLGEFRQEGAVLEDQIQENLRCIREADVYLKTLVNSESEDTKVFSPRRAEIIYKEEIDKTNRKKTDYERQNRELYQKQEKLNSYIGKLETIINGRKNNNILLDIQEEDSQRIAKDLHDISLQNLTHLIHKLELSGMYIDKDPLQAKLELSIISKCLRDAIDEIRRVIYEIRPTIFDDLGLKTTIEYLINSFNKDRKYEVIAEIDDFTIENNFILVYVYRIVQEALSNIEKHAQASKIVFRCNKKDDKCILFIEDNGQSFSESIKEIPLMKERVEILNGKIEVFSEPGVGTRLSIEIPLKEVTE